MPNKYTIDMFGYYDDPSQKEPAYDPGISTPCLFCFKPWNYDDVRTISLMVMDKELREKSYFYRVHTVCHELYLKASPDHIEPAGEWLMTYTTAN